MQNRWLGSPPSTALARTKSCGTHPLGSLGALGPVTAPVAFRAGLPATESEVAGRNGTRYRIPGVSAHKDSACDARLMRCALTDSEDGGDASMADMAVTASKSQQRMSQLDS